jgi:phytoene synthase
MDGATMEMSEPRTSFTIFDPARFASGKYAIAGAADYAACRAIMRRASKNYSSASNYLPPRQRPHVEALYALMRIGDDRVDVSYPGCASRLEAIEDWERTYWLAFERLESPHPVMRAYLDTAIRFGIPPETMSAYFRAMKEDLTITRFPTFDHLLDYIAGSAIPVGRAMTYILGVRQPFTLEEAFPGADSLSIAMQLSNFWRDIGEDWTLGRVYIPQEDLSRFAITEVDLAAQRIEPRWIDLLEFQFERIEAYYQLAQDSVAMLASGRWAVMTALQVYHAILDDVRAHNYDVFTRRAGASAARKIGLALKSYWVQRST